jgi:hypothetical protein
LRIFGVTLLPKESSLRQDGNFFRHSQAYKVIERDAVLARQKLGPLFQ